MPTVATIDTGARPATMRRHARVPFSLVLPIVLLVPSLVFYLGLSISLTLGASAVAIGLIVLSLPGGAATSSTASGPPSATVGVWATMLTLLIGVHLLIAMFLQPVDLTRALLSLIPLALVLTAGQGLGSLMLQARGADLERGIVLTFVLMCVVGAVTMAGIVPPGSETYFKPVFPFTEPSHFALAFLPLLMFCTVRLHGPARLGMLAVGLAVGLGLESLTLMAGWFIIAAVCLRRTSVIIFVAAVVLLASQLDLSYYLDRLDFGNAEQNLSTLVYVQGWQLITEAMARSGGWGLGFQQLGVQGSDVDAADLIVGLLGNNANLLDGGFTLAKLVGEFGPLGALLTLAYFRAAWRAVIGLRRVGLGGPDDAPAVMLARSVVVCFSVEILVRGAGYFSGTTLLLVAAFTILWAQRASSVSAAPPRRPRAATALTPPMTT